jgi:hypothetical protein
MGILVGVSTVTVSLSFGHRVTVLFLLVG